MKRILILFIAIGLTAGTTAMASMSVGKVRKETRFLTDKMAYELHLSTSQYNDVYEINYDFIYSLRNIMKYVSDGSEWALDDYYEALDIRSDDLRWVLSESQYRRFLSAEYFYRPVYFSGRRWSFRVYANYPDRSLFYYGEPYHYRTYCGAHYRPYFHHASYYRGRYDLKHYPTPYRIREQRVFHSYRHSDFGSIRFRSNTSIRPHNAPTRRSVYARSDRSDRDERSYSRSRGNQDYNDFTPHRRRIGRSENDFRQHSVERSERSRTESSRSNSTERSTEDRSGRHATRRESTRKSVESDAASRYSRSNSTERAMEDRSGRHASRRESTRRSVESDAGSRYSRSNSTERKTEGRRSSHSQRMESSRR